MNAPADAAAKPLSPRAPRRHQALRWLAAILLVITALVLTAAAGLWWSLRSERGTAWLLSHVPGLTVTRPQGSLLGDFAAESLTLRYGAGGKVSLSDLAWKGFDVRRTQARGAWALLWFDRLHIQQARVTPPAEPKTKQRTPPPQQLRLPVEVVVQALQVNELQMNGGEPGAQPLRDLRARIHLGADAGRLHRIESLALTRGPLQASGHVRVQTQAPMALDSRIDVRHAAVAGRPAWTAEATLAGPLAWPALSSRLRTATTPAQTLSIDATLQPFAAWPLARLTARAQSLDLAVLAGGPHTALSGDVVVHRADPDRPLDARADLVNAAAGLWNTGRVPVRRVQLSVAADPQDRTQVRLQGLRAELGTEDQAAGRLVGDGRWAATQGWTLDAKLSEVRPDRLDARATPTVLDGTLKLTASGTAADQSRKIDAASELTGRLLDRPATAPLAVRLQGTLETADTGALGLDLRQFEATSGDARATAQGKASRPAPDAPWHAEGSFLLAGFDVQPWWPGTPDAPLRRAPSRLNASGDFDVTVPQAAPATDAITQLTRVRGRADIRIAHSVLAGLPLQGEATLRGADNGLQVSLRAEAAGNHVSAQGRFAQDPTQDQWQAQVNAPALRRLEPLMHVVRTRSTGAPAIAGAVRGELAGTGRWPQLQTHGQLEADGLVWPGVTLRQGRARWQLGTARNASLDMTVTLADMALVGSEQARRVPAAELRVDGTTSAHRIALQADVMAAPARAEPTGSPTKARATTAAGPRTHARLLARGSLLQDEDRPMVVTGWRGHVETLDVQRAQAPQPLLRTKDFDLEVRAATATQPARLVMQPGRAQLMGGVLRWTRLNWQGPLDQAPAQVDADVTLEPMRVAPLLARLQPAQGWAGDLELAGHVRLRTAPALQADVLVRRHSGDLSMSQAGIRRSLGLGELRLAVHAEGTQWTAQARAAGRAIGQLSAQASARTSSATAWPDAQTPIQGAVEMRVADLGIYDPWLPVGWRLGGNLVVNARVAGQLGDPEFSGIVRGSQLAVSNFVEGVSMHGGELRASLEGDRVRIERLMARAGDGTVRIEGGATLGPQPTGTLTLAANDFRALSRVDRMLDVSGRATLRMDAQRVAVDGAFKVDEGLIDLGRSEAPELSKDVRVVDAPTPGAPPPKPASTSQASSKRNVQMDVHVDLGDNLRVRGRGVNTLLAGNLHVSTPEGQLAVNGTVRTEEGTYDAYAQKLRIDRGLITFVGPVTAPRLDIRAVRPDLEKQDIKVGVAITGTPQDPRVRLFSTPEMSELDKLSWLTMGRASAGLATDQTALLQRAAMALLAGNRGGGGGGFAKKLGLDALSVKRGDSGDVSDAVVSLGKQLTERLYVGYQQSLDATESGWELIYKIAQRFTVRVQTGEATAVDLIWTWLWDGSKRSAPRGQTPAVQQAAGQSNF